MSDTLVDEFVIEDDDLYKLVGMFNSFCRLCSFYPGYYVRHMIRVSYPSMIKIKIYRNDRTRESS
jgi:hypothetical protein